LRSNVERIKARTPQGVLLELARLTQGKMHLRGEGVRWDQTRAGPTSSVPRAGYSEPTSPTVHEVTLEYYAMVHDRWYSYLVNKVFIARRRGERDPMSLLRVFAKVDHEGKISLPTNIQREMGMHEGQLVELKVSGSGKHKTLVVVPRDHAR
jgi:hypothetical protein